MGPIGTVVNISAATMMTAGFGPSEPRRSICGLCVGRRFDAKHTGGHRKCQRCRGKGYTTVGSTKR